MVVSISIPISASYPFMEVVSEYPALVDRFSMSSMFPSLFSMAASKASMDTM